MTLEEALKHFDSEYQMCLKLGIRQSNCTRWKEQNFIPFKQQHRINEITRANLPIDLDKEAMEKRLNSERGTS